MPPPSSRETDIATSAESSEDEVLVRLMRSLDGDLSAEEQAKLDAEMRLHPEWQEMKADLAQGTQMARSLFAADGVRRARHDSDTGPRARGLFRAKTSARGTFHSGYRQAAAILIAFAFGAAAASGVYMMRQSDQDSGLRLAGLEASPNSEDLQQHVLAKSLLPLLGADYGADRRTVIDDAAAKLHGTLSVDRGFQLGQNIPCVEFIFAPRDDGDSGTINGIACQSAAGGWQIMTVTADR